MPEVPWLNNLILNGNGEPIAAVYKLELLGAAGTAILLSAVVTKFIVNISWKDWFITFNETCKELALPLLTIMSVVAFAYVTNASGMSTTLGLLLAKTGALFPFSLLYSAGSVFLLQDQIHRPTYCSATYKNYGHVYWNGPASCSCSKFFRE